MFFLITELNFFLELPSYDCFVQLQILKCINYLSADPNCLESLQRADAIRHLIPNLELHDSPLAFQVHNEVTSGLLSQYTLVKP